MCKSLLLLQDHLCHNHHPAKQGYHNTLYSQGIYGGCCEVLNLIMKGLDTHATTHLSFFGCPVNLPLLVYHAACYLQKSTGETSGVTQIAGT